MSASPEEIAIIRAMVADGATLKAIAEALGINKQTVRRWVDAAGFPAYKRAHRHTPDTDRAMLKAASEGRSTREIAEHLEMKFETVRTRLLILAGQGITHENGREYVDPRRRFTHTEETDRIIREWTRKGRTAAAIARALGTNRSVVITRAHALLQDETAERDG
ncbi:helix-turn-helix domain-containing protein [Arsenicitalea aurantiaca]|nr:helix-turn-helix domain-containing protein [Arsenicitalea aurantiaca]